MQTKRTLFFIVPLYAKRMECGAFPRFGMERVARKRGNAPHSPAGRDFARFGGCYSSLNTWPHPKGRGRIADYLFVTHGSWRGGELAGAAREAPTKLRAPEAPNPPPARLHAPHTDKSTTPSPRTPPTLPRPPPHLS